MNKYILAIDLAVRKSGIVLLNDNKEVINHKTMEINKKINVFSLDYVKEIQKHIKELLNELKLLENDKLDLVIELSKKYSGFSLASGLIVAMINEYLPLQINKITYVNANQWMKDVISGYKSQLGSEKIKELIRSEVNKLINIELFNSQDEIDAYMLGIWYESKNK